MESPGYRVLGPVEVLRGARAVPLTGSTVLVMLAGLLLRPNDVVPIETLVDQIWGEKLPDHPRAALHNAVSRARKIVGNPAIDTFAWGYRIRADARHHDLLRFNDLVASADDAMAEDRPSVALTCLAEATALWRPPVLGNIAASPLALYEIPHLTERYLSAVEKRAALLLRLRRHETLAGELAGLSRQYPMREPLTAYLMIGLARAGRRSDALAAYRALRRTLRHELNVDPCAEVQELYVKIMDNGQPVGIPPGIDFWKQQ